MHIKNNIIILVTTALLLWGGYGCSSASKDQGANKQNGDAPIPAVEAVQAKFGSLPLVERLSGTVRSINQVAIHPEISAPVIRVYVQNGDKVKKGKLLVKLRQDDYEKRVDAAEAQLQLAKARVDQAKASVEQVRAQYSRTQKLGEKEMASSLAVETQKAQLKGAEANLKVAEAQESQAEADLQQAQLNFSRTEVRAPVSGYVGARYAEIGMQVSPSSQLMEVGDMDNLKIRISLTEEMSSYISVGQRAVIRYGDSTNTRPLEARISRISPFLDPVTHLTVAEIDIKNPNQKLRPGMFVAVDVYYGESQQATLIPNSAIFQNPVTGQTGIYIAGSLGKEVKTVDTVNPQNEAELTDPTPVTFKSISVVARGQMLTAVTGLSSGDWVVTVGQDLLVNNSQARVRPVTWNRVSSLQQLQQDDLVRALLHPKAAQKVSSKDSNKTSSL